jgi:deoxyribonuclease-4
LSGNNAFIISKPVTSDKQPPARYSSLATRHFLFWTSSGITHYKIPLKVQSLKVLSREQWFGRPCSGFPCKFGFAWGPSPRDLAAYANEAACAKLRAIFGHTGYLINLAAVSCANRDKSIQSLLQEVSFATDPGLPFLVMHPGARLGTGEKEGLKQIAAGLNEVFQAAKSSPVRIALENTAGQGRDPMQIRICMGTQGSCLGCELRHLATIYDRVKFPQRLGICLDTCHLFAAGYDIRTSKGWNAAIQEMDSLIGLDQILAFHLNDSKTDLGSRVDRHAHIGQGKIGRKAFRHIVNDARFVNLPGCLETPKSPDMHEDVENLAVLLPFELAMVWIQRSFWFLVEEPETRNQKLETVLAPARIHLKAQAPRLGWVKETVARKSLKP